MTAAVEKIRTRCPHCGQKMRIKRKYLDKRIPCPACNEPFLVEELASEEPHDVTQVVSLQDKPDAGAGDAAGGGEPDSAYAGELAAAGAPDEPDEPDDAPPPVDDDEELPPVEDADDEELPPVVDEHSDDELPPVEDDHSEDELPPVVDEPDEPGPPEDDVDELPPPVEEPEEPALHAADDEADELPPVMDEPDEVSDDVGLLEDESAHEDTDAALAAVEDEPVDSPMGLTDRGYLGHSDQVVGMEDEELPPVDELQENPDEQLPEPTPGWPAVAGRRPLSTGDRTIQPSEYFKGLVSPRERAVAEHDLGRSGWLAPERTRVLLTDQSVIVRCERRYVMGLMPGADETLIEYPLDAPDLRRLRSFRPSMARVLLVHLLALLIGAGLWAIMHFQPELAADAPVIAQLGADYDPAGFPANIETWWWTLVPFVLVLLWYGIRNRARLESDGFRVGVGRGKKSQQAVRQFMSELAEARIVVQTRAH